VCLKSTGLTQNIGIIGIFSQTAGSTCEFRVNPVNFTLGTRRYYSCTATLANVDMSAMTDAYWSRSTFRKHRATNIFSNAMSTGVAAAGGGRQPERHGLGRARRIVAFYLLLFWCSSPTCTQLNLTHHAYRHRPFSAGHSSLCMTIHPLRTRVLNIFGASTSEATVEPDP
jgi:hypothetical protein